MKTVARAVTREEFWDAMCDPRFVRLSRHTGAIGLQLISTDDPPTTAWAWAKVEASVRKLEPPPSLWSRMVKVFRR